MSSASDDDSVPDAVRTCTRSAQAPQDAHQSGK
jgi:hypothetical protein